MTKQRMSIPQKAKVKAELQKENGSSCPFCMNQDVGHFQIHHIDENPSNNLMQNLILICPNCHSKMTKGEIPPIEVMEKKIELMMRTKDNPKQSSGVNVVDNQGNIIVGDNNTINIKKTHTKKKKRGVPGTIGADNLKADYIAYLTERYNTYLKHDKGKNINYAITGSRLKKKFKVSPTRTIYDLPLEKFDEVVNVLIDWIEGTTLFKMKGRTQKMYSSYMEYIEKYRK